MIIKEIFEENYSGTMIYRGDEREELKVGTIESLGTRIPEGYTILALGQTVNFNGKTGVQIKWPEDPEGIYWILRISECAHIL